MRPPDVLRQKASQDIGAAARRERDDYLDCSGRLGPCIVAGQSDKYDRSGHRCQMQKLSTGKFHRSKTTRCEQQPLA
jgi:hypothetical protein